MLKAKHISKCLAGLCPKIAAEHGFWVFCHIQIFSYFNGYCSLKILFLSQIKRFGQNLWTSALLVPLGISDLVNKRTGSLSQTSKLCICPGYNQDQN